jgi:anti-anti-sigma factor
MLKITLRDDVTELELAVEGELTERNAELLADHWREAAPRRKGKRVVVDLKGVTAIDSSGQRALIVMIDDGAEFKALGPKMAYLVDKLRNQRKNRPVDCTAEMFFL